MKAFLFHTTCCIKEHINRGKCVGPAYSYQSLVGDQCPSETGPTWKYSKYSALFGWLWLDAEEGIVINCFKSNCTQNIPCPNGEGHCENDQECEGMHVCGTDNCENGPRGFDCCTSTCQKDSDCVNQECNVNTNMCRLDSYSTDWSNCSHASPCVNGEGDCDDDTDCEGALLCGNDNCASETTGMDCCTSTIVSGNNPIIPICTQTLSFAV